MVEQFTPRAIEEHSVTFWISHTHVVGDYAAKLHAKLAQHMLDKGSLFVREHSVASCRFLQFLLNVDHFRIVCHLDSLKRVVQGLPEVSAEPGEALESRVVISRGRPALVRAPRRRR